MTHWQFLVFALLAASAVPASAQLCPAGKFSATGSFPCTDASPGFYVPTAGATEAIAAPAGSFVSTFGAIEATQASPGFYVPTEGATEATPAPVGTFVPIFGAIAPIPAAAGRYAPDSAMESAQNCQSGSESYGGAQYCRAVQAGVMGAAGPQLVTDPLLTGFDLGSVVSGQTVFQIITLQNLPALASVGLNINDLSIFGANVSGTGFFLDQNFTGVLGDGGTAQIRIGFTGGAIGLASGSLTIDTDQLASFGADGLSPSFDLSATTAAVPEPASWAMLLSGFGLIGAIMRRGRRRGLGACSNAAFDMV